MRHLLAMWRLLRMGVHLLHGMAVMAWRFPSLDATGRQSRIQWWSAKLVRVAGLRLRTSGQPDPGAALLLANHISWLDIAAIHAVAPRARFVSKADVLAWPLLGWLIRNAGTLFIERERKRDAVRVLHQIGAALQAGDLVAVFPEGTTGSGRGLLPFHANLLQSAIATGVPVQGVALRYSDAQHAVSPAVEFLGDTTLLQTVWRMLGTRGLAVRVDLLPSRPSAGAARRALAQTVRQQIDAALSGAAPRSGAVPANLVSHARETT
ncbi:MAG: lysophospholipid acyltransferase family protein [Rubrivivax sp.]